MGDIGYKGGFPETVSFAHLDNSLEIVRIVQVVIVITRVRPLTVVQLLSVRTPDGKSDTDTGPPLHWRLAIRDGAVDLIATVEGCY